MAVSLYTQAGIGQVVQVVGQFVYQRKAGAERLL